MNDSLPRHAPGFDAAAWMAQERAADERARKTLAALKVSHPEYFKADTTTKETP